MERFSIPQSFGEFYREYLIPLESAIEYTLAQVELISHSCKEEFGRSPIENVRYRIKSPESMSDKLKKHNLAVNAENAVHGVYDAAGVRVVTSFLEDIEVIAKRLKEASGLKVVSEKNYITAPKANGYRSYHIIFEVQTQKKVYIEVQIRTAAMDTWAAADHRIQYKKLTPDSSVVAQELKRCAEELARIDTTLQRLVRVYLSEQQKRSTSK